MHNDLEHLGEGCGKNRVLRLMRQEKLKSQTGYRKRPGIKKSGKVAEAVPNIVRQQFDVATPNAVWVTDITYIRTHEGWLYLAAVMDLFSRQIIGWSMQPRVETDLVLKALLMAIWRRRPEQEVIVHSDQGSQYSSYAWQDFLKKHNLKASMSRRGFANRVIGDLLSHLAVLDQRIKDYVP